MTERKVNTRPMDQKDAFRTFNAAQAAYQLLNERLKPDEILLAIAAMASFDLARLTPDPSNDGAVLNYLTTQATAMVGEVREQAARRAGIVLPPRRH